MKIIVNGQPMQLDEACDVEQLLKRCGLDQSPCAVEVNRTIVPRRQHGLHMLNEGDQVELVTLVGGG